jgi:uncharacterized protein (TIGR02118 family)
LTFGDRASGAPVEAMTKLTVSYPGGEGATFDHDYYSASHVPLCVEVLDPIKTEIDRGLDGPNLASVHFYFDSLESMQGAFAHSRMGQVMADLSNDTNVVPVSQVSEVVG